MSNWNTYACDVTPTSGWNGKTIFHMYGYYGGAGSSKLVDVLVGFGYRVVISSSVDASLGQVYLGNLRFEELYQTQLKAYNALRLNGTNNSDIILTGHSYGGLLALTLWDRLEDVDRPSKLVLLSPFLERKNTLTQVTRFTLTKLPFTQEVLALGNSILHPIVQGAVFPSGWKVTDLWPLGMIADAIFPIGWTAEQITNDPNSTATFPSTTGYSTILTGMEHQLYFATRSTYVTFTNVRCLVTNQDELTYLPSWFRCATVFVDGPHEPWASSDESIKSTYFQTLQTLLTV